MAKLEKRETSSVLGVTGHPLTSEQEDMVVSPSEAVAIEGGTLIKVVADKDVLNLGFAPTGVPLDAVTVARMEEGGWARRQGIEIGDKLHSIGLDSTKTLTKEEILERMVERPLRLTFFRPAALRLSFGGLTLDEQAEMLLRKIQTARQTLGLAGVKTQKAILLQEKLNDKEHNSSANGGPQGQTDTDKVIPVDLALLQKMTPALEVLASQLASDHQCIAEEHEDEEDDAKEQDENDVSHAPTNQSSFSTKTVQAEWPIEEDLPFTVEAQEGVRLLGFAVKGSPPGQVYVETVDPDEWADQEGVLVNDILIMANERIATNLDKLELINVMRGRPLQLTFLRSCDGDELGYRGPPPPAANVILATKLLGRALLEDPGPEEPVEPAGAQAMAADVGSLAFGAAKRMFGGLL